MTVLDDYREKYEHFVFNRDKNGILEMRLHSDGDSLQLFVPQHRELTRAFRDIALDRENRVVLITGTGDEFIGPQPTADSGQIMTVIPEFAQEYSVWEQDAWTDHRELVNALLDIQVPVVAAVQGPARRHCEIPLFSDIIIASDTASFEDSGHFQFEDMAPGDGSHIWTTMLLGINRARAYMLTGEVISAEEALRWGLVKEVLPQDQVLERAREIAEKIAEKSDTTLRFTRALMVQPLKKQVLELLGLGLAYEAFGALGKRA
ncbi:enoyl-CoA hydratase/isomerase family protein [Geodermatophilus sabuli]|uniref:Enoyl-CoA hydratase/carnithine racemase n=1 Tax=Geodermatophilus sabuli TaxID=1564158 RepID=A0A285E6L8_9ACTN|nr:enoyl-CoA hydratase/isomerase family protein [Geodermatophilus sabuli]MBB3082520.1 enoyl-CoA hydratase/carnithine racemase [Geodermatophilus sabuli]SNX94610.1 Enoyl-CoA hydratase/carnithine racemase [Geodermatophilus sabuli]